MDVKSLLKVVPRVGSLSSTKGWLASVIGVDV